MKKQIRIDSIISAINWCLFGIIICLTILFFLSGCGKKDNPEPDDDNVVTQEQIQSLTELSQEIHTWAPTCPGNIACEEDSDGDAMLWAGLLCLSGEASQCSAAFASQRSDGMIGRSPSRLDQEVDASSRDMLLGWLAAVSATKNQAAAQRFQDYIYDNDFDLCEDASDNRCDLNIPQHNAVWGTMRLVWDHIGLKPTNEMIAGDIFGDETIIRAQAFATPRGFGMHLVAVELLIRQKVGHWTSGLHNAASSLSSREPNNPFFEYLTAGKTRKAAELVLQYCPSERPDSAYQWSWQRSSAEQAWQHSMGWDCIFMVNLLTR